jgi:2-polyprenyl-3-methyl-5-hydroxy-6-metoxy-1,4-benzoquinol methylase
MERCSLCESVSCTRCVETKTRRVYLCDFCGLWFVPSCFHVTLQAAKDRYALHDNSADNQHYRKYLHPVALKIADLCTGIPLARVLDFGCGEHAVLSHLLKAENREVVSYDPLYERDLDFANTRYHVIIASEVMEHVADLRCTALLLGSLLHESGYCIIRTKLVTTQTDIVSWWYVNDPTHICFFSEKSINYFASLCGCNVIEYDGVEWAVLQKDKKEGS